MGRPSLSTGSDYRATDNYRCCIDFAYPASQPTVLPDRKVRHCSHCFGGLLVGAVGGVAGWRLVAQGGVRAVVVVLILPIADDDAGVRQ